MPEEKGSLVENATLYVHEKAHSQEEVKQAKTPVLSQPHERAEVRKLLKSTSLDCRKWIWKQRQL